MTKTAMIALFLLAAPIAFAETPDERCAAALGDATKTLERVGPDELSKAKAAQVQAAEKRAFGICNNPDVTAELRNRAIVRWSGTLEPAAAKEMLANALRQTESSDGPESAAVLPLLDAIAGFDAGVPDHRARSLALFVRALELRKRLFGENSLEVAQALINLGTFWNLEPMPDRDPVRAEELFRQAIDIAEKVDARSETLQTALAMLYDLVRMQPGREAEAARIQEQIERVYLAREGS